MTQAAITMVGFVLTLALLLPWLVLVVLVAAVPIVFLQLRLGRLRADTVTDTSVYYRRLLFYRLLATDVRAAKEIRLFGLGDYLTRRMLRDLGTASRIEQDVDRTTARLSVAIAAVSGLVDLVGISLTVWLAVHGRLSIGDVIALLTALVALQQIFRAATDQAATLSGGEWQRVALARAFLREDADVLILDEPSSGLDAQLEHARHKRLRRLRVRKLTLLISHRLNALRDADRIIVLKDGRIAEAGTHSQLLKQSGHYAELFTLQARGYQETQPDCTDEHHATEATRP